MISSKSPNNSKAGSGSNNDLPFNKILEIRQPANNSTEKQDDDHIAFFG